MSVILGEAGQNALWALVGAFLSVTIAALLDLTGAVDRLGDWFDRRRKGKALRRKEREAAEAMGDPRFDQFTKRAMPGEAVTSATDAVPTYVPGKEDLPPEGESPFRIGFRLLVEGVALMLRGLREMASLVILIPWVAVFYMVLVVGAFAVKPLMLRLGVDEEPPRAS